jgi:hemerythrin
MALIEWDESLSVNVEELDGQHRRLIGLINDLNDAMKRGQGKEGLAVIIGELSSYAGDHFATEEKYFDRFAYPDSRRHKSEHTDFVRKVTDFKGEFDSGQLALSVQVMLFLKDWLKGHILGSDKKYGPYFNEKGLR